jgi:hypothetical protein
MGDKGSVSETQAHMNFHRRLEGKPLEIEIIGEEYPAPAVDAGLSC